MNFKQRFIAALPAMPPNLDLRWDEFAEFDRVTVAPLFSRDADFLAEQGLPCDASPFLSFVAYSRAEIDQRLQVFGLSSNCFPIGHNGSGDVLAIDMDTREVVYFNHDFHNLRVFINSTLQQFAESLCIYQEHLRDETMATCLAQIGKIDAPAVLIDSMWYNEVTSELAGG